MKILVIRFSSLGDLVTYEPVIRAVRYFYPAAEITFLTSSVGKALYQNEAYLNHIIVYESLAVLLTKNNKYDLIINLQCNRLSHWLALFLRKKKRVNISQGFIQRLLGIKKPAKSNIEMFKECGLDEKNVKKYWNKTEASLIHLSVSSEPLGNAFVGKKLIALAVGSSPRWTSKRWGVENFLRLSKLITDKNYQVVLVGGADEVKDAQYIEAENPGVLNLCTKTSLNELKQLLYNIDVFVGNDSGPAHIAAAVGCPTVTLFGSTSVKHCVKNLPYKGDHICLVPAARISCHPCYKPECPKPKHECMMSISVEDVLLQVEQLLSEG